MIEGMGCLTTLFGILLYTSRVNGQPAINLPAAGNYNEATDMNCTESTFDIVNGYTWYKDNVQVYDNINGDATNTGKYTSIHGTGVFTLQITNTTLDDNGVYRCNYNFDDDTGTLEIQAKGTGEGKLEGGKLKVTLTNFYPNTTTVSSMVCNGKTFTGTEVIEAVGQLFKLIWTSISNVEISDLKNGCKATIQALTVFDIDVEVSADSTTTTTSTSTTTTSTSSTSSTTTTTTPSSTSTSTSTTSTVTSTTPTSTSTTSVSKSTTPTLTSATASTTTISTTSATSSATKTNSETTTASPDSSSSETVVIIVVSVVGGLFAVGIVITIILMLLKRKKPDSMEIHKYKEDRNNWQFQRPKSLRSVGHSKHDDLYDGKHSRSYFKQNPVFVRHSSRPDPYRYQPRTGRQSPSSVNIYPGLFNGEQYSGSRYVGQDRRVYEAPNYYNPGDVERQYYIHPSYSHRSNIRNPVRETLHMDDQNYIAADYSKYW